MPIFLIPLFALFLNDLTKLLVIYFKTGKFEIKNIFKGGGMPSGHSALVGAVLMVLILEKGIYSLEFMIGISFGALVLNDAIGIRNKSGIHAKILNQIQGNTFLDEKLGHSILEVLIGGGFGSFLAFCLFKTNLFI